MIKILKEGQKPKFPKMIYKTTCKVCYCEFEFTIEDCLSLERRIGGDMLIKCPCCNNIIKCSSLDAIERESTNEQDNKETK